MPRKLWMLLSAVVAAAACDSSRSPSNADASTTPDGSVDDSPVIPPDGPVHPAAYFCDLPGSIRFEPGGKVLVPGGQTSTVPPSINFMRLPTGFCLHHYGKVGNPRQMRFAPGGELFVASPTAVTTGGGSGGLASIVYLPDDNRDGYSDSVSIFQSGLPSTQGLLFTPTHFYYQDATKILRIPYEAGDRRPRDASELVTDITYYSSVLHWPKPIDQADDGTIYVGNGGDQGENCEISMPAHGGIVKLDGTPGGRVIAKGMRNPIAVRCQKGKNRCYAAELAKDYSAEEGGREKLVLIREGDDWGFPCCATKDVPHRDVRVNPDCSKVVADEVSFLIGDTPFSFDFEVGKWPAPYTGSVFVPLHGTAGPWLGARVVRVAVDPATGNLLPGTTRLDGGAVEGMSDFATGWEIGPLMHGRPAAITFADDGRMFLANDNNGDIVWIAPFELER